MFRKIRTRISPAAILATMALFAALGGVSYAAGKIGTGQIKNGAVTKKKLHRNAVATDKIAADAVTGAKVAESTLGTVPDAAKLGGVLPAGFESRGFGGAGDTAAVNLPTNDAKTVSTLSLPAGTYLVLGRGGINNNGGSNAPANQSCTVAAGTSSQKIGFGVLAANGQPGDREEFSAFVVATLAEPGNATIVCETTGGWESGNVTDPTLAAVSLQP